mmetsp:Transcript_43146/g.124744  ORF Transcript_43146/g.124744 Transcript_43146/m.124744 type:complete len:312 (+) Transcript_43146:39-974(+)
MLQRLPRTSLHRLRRALAFANLDMISCDSLRPHNEQHAAQTNARRPAKRRGRASSKDLLEVPPSEVGTATHARACMRAGSPTTPAMNSSSDKQPSPSVSRTRRRCRKRAAFPLSAAILGSRPAMESTRLQPTAAIFDKEWPRHNNSSLVRWPEPSASYKWKSSRSLSSRLPTEATSKPVISSRKSSEPLPSRSIRRKSCSTPPCCSVACRIPQRFRTRRSVSTPMRPVSSRGSRANSLRSAAIRSTGALLHCRSLRSSAAQRCRSSSSATMRTRSRFIEQAAAPSGGGRQSLGKARTASSAAWYAAGAFGS